MGQKKIGMENVTLDITSALAFLEENLHNDLVNNAKVVLQCAIKHQRLPSFILKKDEILNEETYLNKWINAFKNGYNNRPSQKVGKPSNVIPDKIIEVCLASLFKEKDSETITAIVEGHSILMSLENLIGELLEEYLSIQFQSTKWVCAWGSTIDAVDFCNTDGEMLQIKNSDNSENSSSSRVRNKTEIKKWFRRFSRTGSYNWNDLNEKIGIDSLSEDNFRTFVIETLTNNPRCIAINAQNDNGHHS